MISALGLGIVRFVPHRAVTAWMRVVDPLGPTDIDPDDTRDRACDATSVGRICNPPDPDPARPPDTPDLATTNSGAGFFGQVLVALLVLALIVALVWIVMNRLEGSRSRAGDGDDGEALDVDEAIDEVVDSRIIDRETPPDRWRRLAQEARSAGDHREAVRCQYRALIGDLARAGYVDEIPGRTSGEEREQVAEIAPRLGDLGRDVARQFSAAADTFDQAWFDDGEVTASDDERFLAAERAVLDVVLTPAGKRTGRSRNERDRSEEGGAGRGGGASQGGGDRDATVT
ncbi:MAG: DUF4129 domain-containing protein [Ilumatobacter sp.]|uniref:DUF4129 domain-containing protein n=1 Tax=Ilumatobacter sp. TaxID=1967498 RepID=UPI003297B852